MKALCVDGYPRVNMQNDAENPYGRPQNDL
jgi:hypothetical protein